MKVALLRIGIDSGSGGIQGPIFEDQTFEYIPIPDNFKKKGVDKRTYGNTHGRHGKYLVDYFPQHRQIRMRGQPIHFDPEFETFTYGDPTILKSSLRRLERGDLLLFYCGLQVNHHRSSAKLYLVGYFVVSAAGRAIDFRHRQRKRLFSSNFHVRHSAVFRDQKRHLVLVKGGPGSRLLRKAVLISAVGKDRAGKPIKILSPKMRRIFGSFGGKNSIQRSPVRWVSASKVQKAAQFIRSLV